MRVLRPLLLIFAVASLVAPVFARQSAATPSTTSDPQAVAILQKSLAALTGGTSITDVTLTGSAHRIAGSDNEMGTATLQATSAGDSRVDLSFASGNHIEIRNHSALPLPGTLPARAAAAFAQIKRPVGEWIGADGARHAMAGHNVMTPASWFCPPLTLEKISSSSHYVLSYIGQESHDGVSAIHISVSRQFSNLPTLSSSGAVPGHQLMPSQAQIAKLMQHLSQMDIYLDPTSLLPIALDFNQHPDNNASIDIATEIRFSDYKPTNGVLIPMRVRKYLDNGLVLDLKLDDATVNSDLAASAFAVR